MHAGLQALSDEQLCRQCGSSSLAMEELVGRCQKMVRACVRPYFLAGADADDLLQEGMLALMHAVSHYDLNREASFKTFAAVCIRSRLVTLVRSAGSSRHHVPDHLVSTFSFDQLPMDNSLPQVQKSPEELLIGKEEFEEFRSRLQAVLSPLERRTMELYLQGLSYREIADLLQKTTKSVDNAVQRIRSKIARQTIPATTA